MEARKEAKDLSNLTPKEARQLFRTQQYTKHTSNICNGYLQANVVIIPKEQAKAFAEFCKLNSKPAPLLEMLSPGNPFTSKIADRADIRRDLPKYRVWRADGTYEEVLDISKYWTDDLVTFFLGCSFSFEDALQQAGISLRHIESNRNVSMYKTNVPTKNVGGFGEFLVVSMRPIPKNRVEDAYRITAPFEKAHGAPVCVGDGKDIGITDIQKPDYGDAVEVRQDEVPVYWACGITTHVAVQKALKEGVVTRVITHAPGHMFIADLKSDSEFVRSKL